MCHSTLLRADQPTNELVVAQKTPAEDNAGLAYVDKFRTGATFPWSPSLAASNGYPLSFAFFGVGGGVATDARPSPATSAHGQLLTGGERISFYLNPFCFNFFSSFSLSLFTPETIIDSTRNISPHQQQAVVCPPWNKQSVSQCQIPFSLTTPMAPPKVFDSNEVIFLDAHGVCWLYCNLPFVPSSDAFHSLNRHHFCDNLFFYQIVLNSYSTIYLKMPVAFFDQYRSHFKLISILSRLFPPLKFHFLVTQEPLHLISIMHPITRVAPPRLQVGYQCDLRVGVLGQAATPPPPPRAIWNPGVASNVVDGGCVWQNIGTKNPQRYSFSCVSRVWRIEFDNVFFDRQLVRMPLSKLQIALPAPEFGRARSFESRRKYNKIKGRLFNTPIVANLSPKSISLPLCLCLMFSSPRGRGGVTGRLERELARHCFLCDDAILYNSNHRFHLLLVCDPPKMALYFNCDFLTIIYGAARPCHHPLLAYTLALMAWPQPRPLSGAWPVPLTDPDPEPWPFPGMNDSAPKQLQVVIFFECQGVL